MERRGEKEEWRKGEEEVQKKGRREEGRGEERSKERGEREEEKERRLVSHHACQHAPKTPHVERVIIFLVVHEQLWPLEVS